MHTKIQHLIISIGTFLLSAFAISAQPNNYPTPPNQSIIVIRNTTAHIGIDGRVMENAYIVIKGEKITQVTTNPVSITDAIVIDAQGKHTYPGLILCNSQIGLREVSAVRASIDEGEVGDFNSNINSIVAYNTESRITNNVRDNGILIANIAPVKGIISGSSSAVQFDAWNWEDALYKRNTAMHLYLPRLVNMEVLKEKKTDKQGESMYEKNLKKIERINSFFKEAKSYSLSTTHEIKNLRFEAMRRVFSKQQRLFIHCNWVKEMLTAVNIAREFDIRIAIVGGYDSWKITDILSKHNIPVILESTHILPVVNDDNIKQPFLTPYLLQKANILFAINSENTHDRGKNLSYLAGTAASYGLSKEEALQAITINPAKILGIDDKTGSIEVGKDANLIIVEGDVLDMKSSTLEYAFIQGRQISLDNVHKQLRDRYLYKYGLR